ncbi:acyl-CoA--sterol O-acyltransferase 1-like [Abrus precatorius]|uniref:Acyl-CoA--sterol O-acyltransferase 1-like n=1 Tax=Abrus precatorius TaxID=3816 RepID=A0A8B8MIU4_ABRPR|nr:acyl-CoA--sterol O-acyltransferase 1-like [Abrus precatorius]
MEGEISNFISILLQVIASLCYCYMIGKNVPKGLPTLLAILPTLMLFLTLPLHLQTMHLVGILSFFISWLANSKLLLFAFDKGPLSDPSMSLKHFLVVASFPVKIKSKNDTRTTSPRHKSPWSCIIKGIIFAGVLTTYKFGDYIPTIILYSLYCMHVYLCLEIILALVSVLVRTLLGVQPDPHFNEPYLSSSLQDFWSRRWNLAVTNILRLTFFEPTYRLVMPILGPKIAPFPAVFVTFLASGLIHELIFYYLGRAKPTWEITCFFVLHGLCILLEVFCKRKLANKLRLPRMVSGPLTLGFVMVTAFWLFFPQLLRCNGVQRALQEFHAVGNFLKDTLSLCFDALTSTLLAMI